MPVPRRSENHPGGHLRPHYVCARLEEEFVFYLRWSRQDLSQKRSQPPDSGGDGAHRPPMEHAISHFPAFTLILGGHRGRRWAAEMLEVVIGSVLMSGSYCRNEGIPQELDLD